MRKGEGVKSVCFFFASVETCKEEGETNNTKNVRGIFARWCGGGGKLSKSNIRFMKDTLIVKS